MTRFSDLINADKRMGVKIQFDLDQTVGDDPDLMGSYDRRTKTIHLSAGLTSAQELVTLQHETIHAIHCLQHCASPDPVKEELHTRRETARALISSQEYVADALGNAVRTVKRWEDPNYQQPPEDAWDFLEQALKQHTEAVNKSVGMVKQISKKVGHLPDHVDVLYYKTQHQYDLYGRDKGNYMIVNARAREIAVRLEQLGVETRFHYPEENEQLFTELANTRGLKQE